MSDRRDDEGADLARLVSDRDAASPLERVFHAPGVMLGVEAMQAEQGYHQRRLTRHARGLLGRGTLFGLAVAIDQEAADSPEAIRDAERDIRVLVGAGAAIDGLGREMVVPQTYYLNLNDWVKAESGDRLVQARRGAEFHFQVTLRHRDCRHAYQPALADFVNASTDAVVPARLADAFLIELAPVPADADPDAAEDPRAPWSRQAAAPLALTAAETAWAAAAGVTAAETARRVARLARGVPPSMRAADDAADPDPAALARVLLARLRVTGIDPDADPFDPQRVAGLALAGIAVNNLVRAFLPLPSALEPAVGA